MVQTTTEPAPARNKVTETTGIATPPVPFRALAPLAPAQAASGMVPSSAGVLAVSSARDWSATPAGLTWFIAAAMLLGAVLFVPGAVALAFFALSGFIVGGLSLLTGLTWECQASIFAVLGVALVTLWIRADPSPRRDDGNCDPRRSDRGINDRGPASLVGRVFQLEKPIEGGKGMVTCGGTSWRITGKDCAAGTRVKVLHANGTLLFVGEADPLEMLIRGAS